MSSNKSIIWIILLLCSVNHGLCVHVVDVGVLLDVNSLVGRSIHSCITMAISDFYARNDGYKTRIVVHTRDTKGDPLQTISNVVDLLNTVKVKAIVGPETYIGSKLLASVTNKTKVPIFSFDGKSSMEYPFLLHIKEDEIAMAKSIAALVNSFKWRDVIFVYEDSDHGPDILQYLFESFQDKNIKITYKSAISTSATNDQIIKELQKLMKFHTSVIIVHMSPLLASSVFENAKMLGMMSKEYAWILTQKTIEIMHSTEFKVKESFQGVLGVRSYIPASLKLHDLTERILHKDLSREVPMLAIWAYDTIWALAESLERVGQQQNGSMLLSEILKINFKGVSGEFRLSEKELISNGFEIINAVDYGERKVGYWTQSKGIKRAHAPFKDTAIHPSNSVEDVIWPGGSTAAPKGWILRMSQGKKLRIGVPIGVNFKYFVDANYDAEKNVTIATGFSVDVFNTCIQAVEKRYGEVPYEFIPYEKFYTKYDALINKVYIQEIDGVLADTTILANRSAYVDFTSTYTDVGIGTLTRIKDKNSLIFLKPLDVDLWLGFLIFGILTVFTIWAIETMDQGPETEPAQGIGTILWHVLLTIFFAQRDGLSKNLSRFVIFVWLITVLVLITSYTATLTSLLTVEQFELASSGAIIGFHGGSFFGGVTINNVKLSDDLRKAYYSYEQYANALLKGGKHDGADAIVDEVPYIKMFLGRHSNEYAMVKSQPITSGFGFIFAKGSPLVQEMSREIAKLREDGILLNLEKKWFEKEFPLSPDDSFTTPQTLNLDRFQGLFIVTGSSLALALIISIICAVRARMEVESIISSLAGQNLMSIIGYLLYRNTISSSITRN